MDSFETSDCPEPCMAPVSVPNHRVRRNAIQVPASHPHPQPLSRPRARGVRATSLPVATSPHPRKTWSLAPSACPRTSPSPAGGRGGRGVRVRRGADISSPHCPFMNPRGGRVGGGGGTLHSEKSEKPTTRGEPRDVPVPRLSSDNAVCYEAGTATTSALRDLSVSRWART